MAAGGKELVLSGINLGRWGRDPLPSSAQKQWHLDTRRLWFAAIFRETELPRLRLSSIEPMDWDEETDRAHGGIRRPPPLPPCASAAAVRFGCRAAPHAPPLPALALRGKGCGAASRCRAGADPGCGRDGRLSGRDRRRIRRDLELVRALPFGYLHSFPFSPRPGTRGWALHAENARAAAAVEERMAALRALAAERIRAHREQFAGRELEAITLHTPPETANARTHQRADGELLPVEIDSPISANRLVRVHIKRLTAEMKLQATVEEAGRFPNSGHDFMLPRLASPQRSSSRANAILAVRSCVRGQPPQNRSPARETFGGAPSHSTSVQPSPLSASTIESARAKFA